MLTDKCRKKKKLISILRLQSAGAESDNARVCRDHFVALCGFIFVAIKIAHINKLFMLCK